jgi:protein-S-isoprenylcysteine O-methyltransferase Ste14
MRIPVPWVFVLTYILGAVLEHALPLGPRNERPLSFLVAGGIVLGIGAAIAGWGLVTFRAAQTTTVPGKASSRLVTWGPYRFTRNPMYVGLIIAYLGETIILRQLWPVILLPLIVAYLNWIVIPVEESKLKEVFLEDYDRYRAKVRRWL